MPSLFKNDISTHGKSCIKSEHFIEQYTDPIANAPIGIDIEHSRIHQGLAFDFSDRILAVPAGVTTYMLIKPNAISIHLRDFCLSADSSPVQFELFENPSGTDDGILRAIAQNRNRYSPLESPCQIFYDPIVTDDGLRLKIDSIEGDKKDSGDLGGIGTEWILNGEKIYLIKIINQGILPMNYQVDMFWYHIIPIQQKEQEDLEVEIG